MKNRKITVLIPEDLLDSAMQSTDKNLTDTIKEGLKLLGAHRAYQQIAKLRGKIKLSYDVKRSRKDRSE